MADHHTSTVTIATKRDADGDGRIELIVSDVEGRTSTVMLPSELAGAVGGQLLSAAHAPLPHPYILIVEEDEIAIADDPPVENVAPAVTPLTVEQSAVRAPMPTPGPPGRSASDTSTVESAATSGETDDGWHFTRGHWNNSSDTASLARRRSAVPRSPLRPLPLPTAMGRTISAAASVC
ncbi:hypothetical protein [Microbacterium sp.]|uniref:hypothetical protein n=1 Tax=Microbacterium sp. TaxID=51671 RepID=UPI003F9BEFF8